MATPGYRTESELAKFLNKDFRTLQRWRRERTGPPVTMIGKTPLYRLESTDAWLRSLEQGQVREQSRKRRLAGASHAEA